MKTVKGNCKRTSKEEEDVWGDYDRIDRFICATAIFFGTKAYHNYKEEEFFKSVKEKKSK